MNTPLEILTLLKYINQSGLWKFYLMEFGLVLAFFSNLLIKKKTKLNILAITSLGTLLFFLSALLIVNFINT